MYNIKSLRLNVRRGLYLCLQKSATANGEAEAERFYKTAEREKQQLEKSIKELDNIIRCLYEDRVCGMPVLEMLLPSNMRETA